MAETTIATTDSSAKKLYEETLIRTNYISSFWLNQMNQGNARTRGDMSQDNILVINRKLNGGSGDRVSIDFIDRFTYEPRGENDALEGHEGELDPFTFNLTLSEKHVLLKWKGKLSAKRPAWMVPETHRAHIESAGAEAVDKKLFDALQATATNKQTFGGDATSVATLEADDKLTPFLIEKVKTKAKTGFGRTQNAFSPVRAGTDTGLFCLLVSPDVHFDISRDPEVRQSMREALPRSERHPLFRPGNGDLIWRDVVIKSHERINNFDDGGASGNLHYSKAYFMGAGAMAFAWGQDPEIETETFEYKTRTGVDFNWISAEGRPNFDSKDYAVTEIVVAATDVVNS